MIPNAVVETPFGAMLMGKLPTGRCSKAKGKLKEVEIIKGNERKIKEHERGIKGKLKEIKRESRASAKKKMKAK